MAEIINLNKVRKQKLRAKARQSADRNAATSGISKLEKERNAAKRDQDAKRLDGHEIDKEDQE